MKAILAARLMGLRLPDNSPSAATLTGNVDFGGKTDVLRVSWSALEANEFSTSESLFLT